MPFQSQVSGPNQNLHLVVDDITKDIRALIEKITEEELRNATQNAYDSDSNAFTLKYYATELRTAIIRPGYLPSCDADSYFAKSIQLSEMQDFCRKSFSRLKIFALIQGNLCVIAAKSIMQMVEINLDCGRIEFQKKPSERQALQLPLGANHLLVNTRGLGLGNSATLNYYQIGPISLRTKLLIELLVEFSRNSRLYDRINENVRYCDISWEVCDDFDTLGYYISANTTEDNISAIFVNECIEKLRSELVSVIENLSDDEFKNSISSMIANNLPNDDALKDEVDRNWTEILSGKYFFDRYHRENEIVATISRAELLKFCHDSRKTNERKLCVQLIGHG